MANWRTYIDPSVGDGQNTIDGIIANGPTYGIQISDDLNVTGLSTFSDIARFSSTIRLDGQLRDGDNNFGSSGQVLSSDGTDTRWVNAAQLSAGAAAQIAINADNSTNANRFLTFVDSSSGNNDLKTDTGLTYNPSTNTISASLFSGNLTGNVTGTIQTAAQTNITSLGTLTGLTVGGNIMPNSDSTRNIGSNSVRFEAGYFDSVFGSGSNLTDLNASNLSSGTVNTARLPDTYTKAAKVTIQATGLTNDVHLDAADNIILESGEEESGAIYFRGNNGASSYRFSKGGQTTHEGFLSFESLSADRTFTFPNVTGTIALTSSDITGNAASATILETSRNFSISGDITASSISFNGSGNVALSATIDTASNGQFLRKRSGNTGGMTWEDMPIITGDTLTGNTLASGIVNSSLTSLGTLGSLTVTNNISITDGSLNVGDGGHQSEILIKKADNNTSDHLQFYNGTTRIGEIGCHDNTWLRINQHTNKNIYTPRIFRADGGFQVDGDTVIDGSGNIVASKVPTLNQNTTGTSGGFTAGNAGNLNAGTIPNARFPSTLPTLSGQNLTSLNASSISSGTVNTDRLPSTYSKAANITIAATGSGKDINLDAADNIVLDAGVEDTVGSIFFRANGGASSYRFSKGGQTNHEGFLSFESISADRTYTYPNKNGTVAMTSDLGATVQTFTSSGTWTKPSTGTVANVYMWGGGGGGGGNSNMNGGGGGGGYAEYNIPLTDLGNTVSVTVGSGGAVNSNGGTSKFGNNTYQAGGGNAGHNGTNTDTSGYGGNGGSPRGTGTGGNRGFYTSSSTDDGTSVYSNTSPESTENGHSGGGGGSAAGGGISNGGSAYMAGGGGGARRHGTNSSGGTSRGGGNGGNGNSAGSQPGGGGGGRKAGAKGRVRVVVV